ncbi:MAG: isochorismatase family protein [Pikeienuella sp.]
MVDKSIALLLIDIQMAFVEREKGGAVRSMPSAEENIACILAHFRENDGRVIHIHHHSKEPGSAFRADLPGAVVQPFVVPRDGEAVYVKHVNSGFIGTSLEADLRANGVDRLIMCGATANHCVETTTRMAGNLGFDVFYLSDGVWAYSATGPDGREHHADDVHSNTLCSLDGEFATVVTVDEMIGQLA